MAQGSSALDGLDGHEAGAPVFVSYARRDGLDLAGRLAGDLQVRGHRVWIDLDAIDGGGLFDARIEEAIRTASHVLALLTPSAVREESVCRDEVVFALNEGKSILPLLAHAAVRPPLLLARRHWIDLTRGYESGLEMLVRYLTGDRSGLRPPALSNVTGVAPLDFGPEVARFSSGFVGREWLEKEVRSWRESTGGRALVIVGEPGIGKSAIAARLTLDEPDVAGVHFCTHRNSRSLDPHEFVASLVAQFHARLGGYGERVEARQPQTRRSRAADAFRELVVEPSRELEHAPRLVVIDALDEASGRPGETIVDVLAEQAPDLPAWLRIIATTRPEARVLDQLRVLDVLAVDAAREENRDDVLRYTRSRLAPDRYGQAADRIAELAAGNFLFARLAVEAVESGAFTPDDLGRLSPGLAEFYAYAFRRRFPDRELFARTHGPLLGALAVARAPLSFDTLERVGGEDAQSVHRRLRDLSAYLRVSGAGESAAYSLFHKSLQDWLTSPEASGDYWCPAAASHRRLALALSRRWPVDRYALGHLPAHLTASRQWDEMAQVLCDLAFVEARCAAGMTFDLVADYHSAVAATQGEQQWAMRSALEDFTRFVTGQAHALATRPGLVRQQAANQPDGSAVAAAAGPSSGRWLQWLNKPQGRGPAVMILAGHTRMVCACAYSPDGRVLVSASADKSLRLWDAETGAPGAVLLGHSASVLACCFTPDGRRVVSAGGDQTVMIWDAQTETAVATLSGHTDAVLACAVSSDGRRLASASFDRTLRTWDAWTGEALRTFAGHGAEVCACAWSPDGRLIASGSHDRTVRIWDAQKGELRRILSGHARRVVGCAFSPDGRRLVSASYDATLKVWDVETGELLATLQGHGWAVSSCAWSPDGSRIVSGSADQTLRLWDAATGRSTAVLRGHSASALGVCWSPDGRRVVSASVDATLVVWDAEEEKGAAEGRPAHARAVTSCAFSPDGRQAISGSLDHNLALWDAGTGDRLAVLQAHADRVSACAWSPDGARWATASWTRSLKIWEAERREPLFRLQGHTNVLSACAWSPDGAHLVSAGWDRRLRLWHATAHGGAAALSETLPAARTTVLAGHIEAVTTCAFSPDGRRIASGSYDRTIKLWGVSSRAELATLAGHENVVTACAFSPDGRFLASSSEDATVRLWDLRTGKAVRVLRIHEGITRGVAWTLDGQYVASGSDDKTFRLWRAESGEEVMVFVAGASVHCVAVGPDSRAFLCGDGAGRVLFLRAHGLELGPLTVTATRLYRHADARWDEALTARCGHCGTAFSAPLQVLDSARALAEALGTKDDPSPALELPAAAFDDARLVHGCPSCRGRLRFNPYLVDGRGRPRPDVS